MLIILLSCGHYIQSGGLAYWLGEQYARHDVHCARCPAPGESYVDRVLQGGHREPTIWFEVRP
jgi:hypothetical protein